MKQTPQFIRKLFESLNIADQSIVSSVFLPIKREDLLNIDDADSHLRKAAGRSFARFICGKRLRVKIHRMCVST